MDLTETQKHSISEKLNRAIEAEHLMLTEAARNLGTQANYLSMIRNTTQWHKCAKSGWDAVNQWANSGQKLSEYSMLRGRIAMPENNELKPEVKKVLVAETKEALRAEATKKPADNISLTAPLPVEPVTLDPGQQFTDTARMKVELDIEISLVINGQKVKIN